MQWNGLVLIGASYIGFYIAYKVYGKWLGGRIFKLCHSQPTPAVESNDGKDYIPTRCAMVFGHHFTSIAGTGPIVGPAIGVIWGWLPAFIWVVFGSIFMGAVHDLGVLVLSLRHQGRSICDIADTLVSPMVRRLFFFVVCLALWIVIAIFGLVIAIIFHQFPESVIPVWTEIPIAIAFGWFIKKYKTRFSLGTMLALVAMTVSVFVGHWVPFTLDSVLGIPPTGVWTILLLIYASIASVLPVNTLLQPRDYLNAWQLFVALGLLVLGAIGAGFGGQLTMVAPAVVVSPEGAPSLWPFLFITIACGAISGFHSLVASGTSSKQIQHAPDAVPVGYGSMVIEGALAVMIIVACCAGIGMGYPAADGSMVTGVAAWNMHYASWGASAGLASKLQAVVVGCANMMSTIGVPQSLGMVIMGVFIASFAGTTLDTATRLQRYMITEVAQSVRVRVTPLWATVFAVVSAGGLAFSSGMSGKGALQLWPLFGALNQLLAAIGLGMVSVYLCKTRPRYLFVSGVPCVVMSVLTAWACLEHHVVFIHSGQWGLMVVNLLVLGCGVLMLGTMLRVVWQHRMMRMKRARLL